MDWYRNYFREPYGEIYAEYLLSADMSREEAHFARRVLGLRGEDRVLDCPCGYGRHMDVLRSLLPHLVGVDLDSDCLRRGKHWSPALPMVRGDMRRLPFSSNRFDVVLNLFNSFGYFTEAENHLALLEFARVLRPGGRVMIDVANPGPLIEIVTETPRTSQRVMDLRLTEEWLYDPASRRLHNETRIELGGKVLERRYDLRIYNLDEVDELLAASGLRRTRLYGDFDDSAYDVHESTRLIVIAEKIED